MDNYISRAFCFRIVTLPVIFFLILSTCSPSLLAAEKIPDSDAVYSFATYSYEQGDYMTSEVEFRRFVFFYPDDPRTEEAAFKIGMSRYHRNQHSKAIEAFETVVNTYGMSHFATEAAFMIAESYLRLEDNQSAISQLHILAERSARQAVRDRALYRLGWILLQQGELSSARNIFTQISAENQQHYKVEEIMERLDHPKELPRKSPLLAGLYSIIPGGGYFYTGRYKDGLIAFLVNVGLGAAAYENFDNDLYTTGSLLTLVNLGFYSGNIYGGINAAQKYNQDAYDNFVNELKLEVARNLTFQIKPTPQSIFLSFNYKF